MKKLLLIGCVAILASISSCKRDLNEKNTVKDKSINLKVQRGANALTLKDKFFKEEFEQAIPLITTRSSTSNQVRYILPLKTEAVRGKIFKYLLLEANENGRIKNSCYLISKKEISRKLNLYSLPLHKDTILFYERTHSNGKDHQGIIKEKLTAKISGRNFNADATAQKALPCDEGGGGQVVCIDWYWVTYNADTGQIISEDYLYTTCADPCTSGGGGGGGDGEDDLPDEPIDIYICASSFNFQSQGSGSITNIAKTWGINGTYISSGGTYTTTFGVTTYAPTDVINWGTSWSHINVSFYYLVQSGDIWLRTDNQGGLHLMYSSHAQSEIAAAATDYASHNSRNPKNVLALPSGSTVYKQKFQALYTDYMKNFIPGTTTQLQHSPSAGFTQATYRPYVC